MTKSVAIIGAGITGLSSAYFLKQQDPNIDVTIFEASNRPGGKIQSYRKDGYMIELGPESYLGRKTIMTELAKDIGLEQDIVTEYDWTILYFCEKQIVSYSRWINYGNSDRYQTVCDN